ncbi:MAG: aspartyl protease family protein [candidate division NC10 bacterium]|nr:aspartyl protease family protein [candidate division NC10 bacterium]
MVGLTVLEIEVGNPVNSEVTEKVEFLIDSGAIYSVVPTPILESLGIQPLAEQEFRLADGTKIVRKKGIAVFKYGDRIARTKTLAYDSCRLVGENWAVLSFG